MTGSELLDHVGELNLLQRRSEVADPQGRRAARDPEQPQDPRPLEVTKLNGSERAKRFGGARHPGCHRVRRLRVRRPARLVHLFGARADRRRPGPDAAPPAALAPGAGPGGEGLLRPLRGEKTRDRARTGHVRGLPGRRVRRRQDHSSRFECWWRPRQGRGPRGRRRTRGHRARQQFARPPARTTTGCAGSTSAPTSPSSPSWTPPWASPTR